MNGMMKIMTVGGNMIVGEGRGSESRCKGGWGGIAIHGLFDCEKSLAILGTTALEQAGHVLGRYIIFEPRSHVNVYLDGLEQF